jgi:hypothetical protein
VRLSVQRHRARERLRELTSGIGGWIYVRWRHGRDLTRLDPQLPSLIASPMLIAAIAAFASASPAWAGTGGNPSTRAPLPAAAVASLPPPASAAHAKAAAHPAPSAPATVGASTPRGTRAPARPGLPMDNHARSTVGIDGKGLPGKPQVRVGWTIDVTDKTACKVAPAPSDCELLVRQTGENVSPAPAPTP